VVEGGVEGALRIGFVEMAQARSMPSSTVAKATPRDVCPWGSKNSST
jgi:hypothetical protein